MIFGPITAIRWTELEVVRVTKEERNIEATIDEGVRVMGMARALTKAARLMLKA